MRKTKHQEHGLIEKSEVLVASDKIAQFKYFLLVVDISTKKVLSRFGTFDSPEAAVDYAKAHSITVE